MAPPDPKTRKIEVRVDEDLLAVLDDRRGPLSRSQVVRDLILAWVNR